MPGHSVGTLRLPVVSYPALAQLAVWNVEATRGSGGYTEAWAPQTRQHSHLAPSPWNWSYKFHWPLFLISSHIGRGCHTNKTTDSIQVGWIARSSGKHNALIRSSERGSILISRRDVRLRMSCTTLGSLTARHRYSHSMFGGQAGGTSPKNTVPLHTPLRHGLATTGASLVVGFCLVRALSQLPSSSLTPASKVGKVNFATKRTCARAA